MKPTDKKKVAVLITSFNRVDITLRCLNQLFTIDKEVDVFLVDDDSTDGTYKAIENGFPEVTLIRGTGNLFWNRGMYYAWENAAKYDYDYYLWLNDDVFLYETVITELLNCSSKKPNSIIVGIIESVDKSQIIYGGTDKKGSRINPLGEMKEITLMNGNVVLIPRMVFHKVGNLDFKYHHDLGDIDYGLRAQKLGVKVYSTRTVVGSCNSNEINRFRLINSTLIKRFKKLYSPTGAKPKLLFYFHRKHYGLIKAILYFITIHIRNIFPDPKFIKFQK